jgi:FAD synthase
VRDDMKFDSMDALKAQIAKDKMTVEMLLADGR